MSESNKTRLTFELDERTARVLDELKAKFGGETRSDVIRRALKVARTAGHLSSKGEMILRDFDKDGLLSPDSRDDLLKLFGDRALQKRRSDLKQTERLRTLSRVPIAISSVIVPERGIYEGRLIEAVSPVWDALMDVLEKDWSEIYRIPPDKLEELVATAYKKDGYDQVILTKRSGDDGRDVIAIKNGRHCVKIIGSVKRYAQGRLVRYDDVRAFLGVLNGEQDASKGLIVTTSDFPAKLPNARFIKPYIPTRLELMNGKSLQEWVMKFRRN